MKKPVFILIMFIMAVGITVGSFFILNYIDYQITQKIIFKIEDYLDRYQLKKQITYQTIDYTLFTNQIEIRGIELKDNQNAPLGSIETIIIKSFKTDSQIIEKINMSLGNIILFNPNISQFVSQYDLPDNRINMDLQLDLKKDGRNFYFETRLEFFKSGVIEAVIHLSDFNLKDYRAYIEKLPARESIQDKTLIKTVSEQLLNLKVRKLMLSFTDLGMISRYIAEKKKSDQLSDEEVIMLLESRLNSILSGQKDSQFVKESIEKIKRLIRGSGKIILESRPKKDFLLKDFEQWNKLSAVQIDQVVDALNITLNYEK